MWSLTLSSLNYNKQSSINEPQMIMDLALELKSKNIKAELEGFDIGMVNYAYFLIKKPLIHHNILILYLELLHAPRLVLYTPAFC